jgi:copper(I)-binding protein
MRAPFATAFGLLLLAACNRTPAAPQVTAEDVIVTLPAVSGRPGAAYFELRTNRSPSTLVSVTSPLVQRIELHQTTQRGMGKITSPEDLSFPGNRTLEFEPGGKHAMLFGINKAVKVGDTIPLTFTVDPAPAVTVEAEVRGPGDVPGGHEG